VDADLRRHLHLAARKRSIRPLDEVELFGERRQERGDLLALQRSGRRGVGAGVIRRS
jgi:hypothetical protein